MTWWELASCRHSFLRWDHGWHPKWSFCFIGKNASTWWLPISLAQRKTNSKQGIFLLRLCRRFIWEGSANGRSVWWRQRDNQPRIVNYGSECARLPQTSWKLEAYWLRKMSKVSYAALSKTSYFVYYHIMCFYLIQIIVYKKIMTKSQIQLTLLTSG